MGYSNLKIQIFKIEYPNIQINVILSNTQSPSIAQIAIKPLSTLKWELWGTIWALIGTFLHLWASPAIYTSPSC